MSAWWTDARTFTVDAVRAGDQWRFCVIADDGERIAEFLTLDAARAAGQSRFPFARVSLTTGAVRLARTARADNHRAPW